MILTVFESLPIAAICLVVALLMLLSCEVGFRFGMRARSRQHKEAPGSLGSIVAGLLGMLAFVLAFTFSMAAGQFDTRKKNVLDEANAVGTAYLRTDLVDSSFGAPMRGLLRQYVDVRLQAASGGDLDAAIARSVEIHGRLWRHAAEAARASPNTNSALLVQSVNELIDLHEKRLTGALHNRIPDTVWLALVMITALTMVTMGVQVGLTGKRRLVAVLPLSLAFAVLVTLVVDLNRPQGGLIKVGQQAMIELQRSMGGEAGR